MDIHFEKQSTLILGLLPQRRQLLKSPHQPQSRSGRLLLTPIAVHRDAMGRFSMSLPAGISTQTSRWSDPAGVSCGSVQRSYQKSNPRLQFDRFNFSDESLDVVGKERADHVKHGVTEATDVHDVSSLTSLNRLVRLKIDVDQLWVGFLSQGNNRQPLMV